ncbi:MAG: phosphotransferase [Eggerthellaceae bacterium]|nr:phosphotransferase [Eggerthellaceae bacterium]
MHRLGEEAPARICAVLHCEPSQIRVIDQLTGGLTNKSWRIEVDGAQYVYRIPGVGTEEITDRECETRSQEIAAKLGIDGTFIFEDPQTGWKLSHYLEGCVPFSCHNEEHLQKAMAIARTLHGSGAQVPLVKDMHEDTIKQVALLEPEFRGRYGDFEELFAMAERYNEIVKADGLAPVLCHNDFYDPNFLIHGDEVHLIDWEYAGMSDYASDLAVFVCCSDYTYEEALHALEVYFQRPLTDAELLHCVAYIQVISVHWLVWALYMAQCGEPVGPLETTYHQFASEYGVHADELLKKVS